MSDYDDEFDAFYDRNLALKLKVKMLEEQLTNMTTERDHFNRKWVSCMDQLAKVEEFLAEVGPIYTTKQLYDIRGK